MAVYNGGIRFAPDVYYDIKENGDNITVLRNGEEIGGGSSGVFTVNVTDTETTRVLDKTWQEIHDAFVSGLACIIHREFESGTYTLNYENMIISVRYGISDSEEDEYLVLHTDTEFGEFLCNSPTDYPYIEL